MQETQVWFLGQEDPLQKEWLPIPVFLPGEFHGQRSLAGHSPWGCKELNMTGWLALSLSGGYVMSQAVQNEQERKHRIMAAMRTHQKLEVVNV